VAARCRSTLKLAEVEPADVRDLFGDLRRAGATTSAIKKLRAALSAMFATAFQDGLVRSNPIQGVRVPTALPGAAAAAEDKAKALTRAELSVFLGAVDADWLMFCEFLVQTGLRIGEAVGLRWEHLDLGGEHPKVMVREQVYEGERKVLKSKYSVRDIPLSPAMASKLLAHRRDTYRGPKTPVFASAAGTELRPANIYRRVIFPAAKAARLIREVEGESKGKMVVRERSLVSGHTLRHTCASLLFERGRNVKQVSRWLGHANASFTLETYVHLMDEGIGDAEFFGELFESTPTALTPVG
jgi:integrase